MHKVYILHCCDGCEQGGGSTILGVFSTKEEAKEKEDHINRSVEEYVGNIFKNSQEIKKLMDEWFPDPITLKEIWAKEREIHNTSEVFSAFLALKKYIDRTGELNNNYLRKSYYDKIKLITDELPEWVDLKPLPTFPPIIEWVHDFPVIPPCTTRITEWDLP